MRDKFKGLAIVLSVVGFLGLFNYFLNLPETYSIPLDKTLDQAIIGKGSQTIENLGGNIYFSDIKTNISYSESSDFLAGISRNQTVAKVIKISRKDVFSDIKIETNYYLPIGDVLIRYSVMESQKCSSLADTWGDIAGSDRGISLGSYVPAKLVSFFFWLLVIVVAAHLIAAIIEWLAGFLTRMRREAKIWFASNWPRNKD